MKQKLDPNYTTIQKEFERGELLGTIAGIKEENLDKQKFFLGKFLVYVSTRNCELK